MLYLKKTTLHCLEVGKWHEIATKLKIQSEGTIELEKVDKFHFIVSDLGSF